MAVLLNALGRPEPSPEVVRRLKKVHPNLFLRYIEHLPEQWAVCWTWPTSDVRWRQVQEGSVNPDRAFDIIGYLPMGCSADEAPAYLQRVLRSFPSADINALVDKVLAWNDADPVQQQMHAAIAEVLDSTDPTGLTKVRRSKRVTVSP